MSDIVIFGLSSGSAYIALELVIDFVRAALGKPRPSITSERKRCARIASNFTFRADRKIHPDIAWDDMNETAKMVAHTTAQQIAEAIMEDN